MNYENSHTYSLEKLYGAIRLEIIKQSILTPKFTSKKIKSCRSIDYKAFCGRKGITRSLNS
ncbi:MAG: hypothetical protein DA407_10665 [Bacteroidetes bacterium]|nr:MAG: hypothetical protein DA407_10665 [Bacteroidota bacterium]